MNHLGWLRELRAGGFDLLPELLADRQRLSRLAEAEIFGADWLATLGAVPNEYLYYFYRHREAVATLSAAQQTRGEFLRESQQRCYAEATAAAVGARRRGDRRQGGRLGRCGPLAGVRGHPGRQLHDRGTAAGAIRRADGAGRARRRPDRARLRRCRRPANRRRGWRAGHNGQRLTLDKKPSILARTCDSTATGVGCGRPVATRSTPCAPPGTTSRPTSREDLAAALNARALAA